MKTLPPDPKAWTAGRITLHAEPDGTMAGTAIINGADWHVRAWRREGAGQVVFEVQPVSDDGFEAISNALARTVAG